MTVNFSCNFHILVPHTPSSSYSQFPILTGPHAHRSPYSQLPILTSTHTHRSPNSSPHAHRSPYSQVPILPGPHAPSSPYSQVPILTGPHTPSSPYSQVSVSWLEVSLHFVHEVVKALCHGRLSVSWLHGYHSLPQTLEILQSTTTQGLSKDTLDALKWGHLSLIIFFLQEKLTPEISMPL